jgi:uncharacterized membrane protein YebE (DUF533 family)
MDPKQLIDQLLRGQAGSGAASQLGALKQRFETSGLNSFGGGAAVGGVLGLLLGGKKVKKLAGGALGYGGAAMLGALALRAWQNYSQGQVPQGAAAPPTPEQLAAIPPASLPHAQPAGDGTPFERVLMQAIVGAARADGHLDANEQRHVFAEVERLGLDAAEKAQVFDLLNRPADLSGFSPAIGTEAQRAEIYLAARLATDADHPAERAYLDALASRLGLPDALRTHVDLQANTVMAGRD